MKQSQLEWLTFDDPGEREQVAVTPLGSNLYRLAETPLGGSNDLELGTVVETERDDDGTLRVIRIVERAPFDVSEFLLDHRVRDSQLFKEFCDKLERAGGEWELIMGVDLRIHLSPDSTFDAEAELRSLLQRVEEDV